MIIIKIGEIVFSDVRMLLDTESYQMATRDSILIENKRSSTVCLSFSEFSGGIMLFGFDNNGWLVQKEAIYLATQTSHHTEVFGKYIFIAKLQYLIFDDFSYLEQKLEVLRYIPTRANYHINQYFENHKGDTTPNWNAYKSAMERDIALLSDEELVLLFNPAKVPLTHWNTYKAIGYGLLETQFRKRMINIDCIKTECGILLKHKVRLDKVNRKLELEE